MAYSYSIVYTPGKNLVLANALLQAPVGGKLVTVNELKDSKMISEMGWPEMKDVPNIAKSCYLFRDYLTYVDGVVWYHSRVFIPLLEKERVLQDIHRGHQRETKCIRRAMEIVCRFITVHELQDSFNTSAVIKILEEFFCTLGAPNTMISDNGPQFVSEERKKFFRKWDIEHITSAPRFPRSNGAAKRAVRTVKGLMNKTVNLQSALCMYRDTPLANGYSPAELLFGRPMNSMGIMPEGRIDLNKVKAKEEMIPGTVVATSGREVVARSESDRLFRRNRAQVRGRGNISAESREVQASSGEKGAESGGVQAFPGDKGAALERMHASLRASENQGTKNLSPQIVTTREEEESIPEAESQVRNDRQEMGTRSPIARQRRKSPRKSPPQLSIRVRLERWILLAVLLCVVEGCDGTQRGSDGGGGSNDSGSSSGSGDNSSQSSSSQGGSSDGGSECGGSEGYP
ncbi:uncharacterized protein [Watersipora subatra]|uniref:uncharacterized protein n=1 Tax=Watersipora subatra TaxID=2589382 RepID=UPI00355ADD1E